MVSRRVFIGAILGAAASGLGGFFLGGGPSSSPKVDPLFGFTGIVGDPPPRNPAHEVFLAGGPRPPEPAEEFFFQPVGLLCLPGDTVMFIATTPGHTVTAYHALNGRVQRVPEGVPPFSSPVLPRGTYWLYTFEREGVYDLYSASQERIGMAMRVVATSKPRLETPPADLPPAAANLRPPEPLAELVLRDPALEPNNIIRKVEVPWAALNEETRKSLTLAAKG